MWAKVAAANVYGISDYSEEGDGAIILTVPDAPIELDNNALVTTMSRIGIVWQAGIEDGGTPVIDYRVSWDQGTGTWDIRQSGLSTLSYTASSLTAGTIYSFRVEARNAYGFSEYSQEVSVLAASKPSTPIAPTTTIDGSNVII